MATGNLRLTLTNIRKEGHKAQHPIVRRVGGGGRGTIFPYVLEVS